MHFKQYLRILSVSFLLLIILSCSKNTTGPEDNRVEYNYQVPEQVNNGWNAVSMTDAGMNTDPIVNLMNDLLNRNDHYIHGLLIIKDGNLVFEEYFNGSDLDVMADSLISMEDKNFDRQTLHFQASVTKSVTSILVGIAVDKGFIPGANELIFSLYPEHADLKNTQNENITVYQMLAMCSGITWDESTYPYDDPRSDTYQLLYSEDPVRFMLGKPVESFPGSTYFYNSGTTNILGEIVRKTSGQLLTDFAKQYLFDPLGIDTFEWMHCRVATQVAFASGGLYLKPRAMAKIGQLYLQEGIWNGNRLVSAEWVRESVKQSIPLPVSMHDRYHAYGYGYQWWLERYSSGTIDAYSARGWGNQYIVVLPEVDIVVVITGGAFNVDMFAVPYMFYEIVQDYILPAVR